MRPVAAQVAARSPHTRSTSFSRQSRLKPQVSRRFANNSQDSSGESSSDSRIVRLQRNRGDCRRRFAPARSSSSAAHAPRPATRSAHSSISPVRLQGGPIVGITSASQDVARKREALGDGLRRPQAPATSIFPIIETREDACNRATAKIIARSRGIFLGGGNQIKLITHVERNAGRRCDLGQLREWRRRLRNERRRGGAHRADARGK